MSNEAQQNQENGDKSQKKFDDTLLRIQALLGKGVTMALPRKLNVKLAKVVDGEESPLDPMEEIVKEVFKEENENLFKEVKEGLRVLLKKKVEFDVSMAEEEKKLEKLRKEKMEQFVKDAQNLFGKIDGLDSRVASYKQALASMGGNGATPAAEAPVAQM